MSPPLAPGGLRLEGVGKRYPPPDRRAGSLKSWWIERWRRPFTAPEPGPWALRGLSLELSPGSSLAIVGSNGAGKSTLLKLLAGLLPPDEGRVAVAGRVAALLELGAGFHPEFSGRENAWLYAAMLGLRRREIQAKLPEVIAFAGLEAVIDHPLRTYSTGMAMRLAFAVAIQVAPDVLLIDEALAVGDAAFQLRCLEALHRHRAAGRTLVLVTHDAGAAQAMASQALWLDRGVLRALGPCPEVLAAYLEATAPPPSAELALGPSGGPCRWEALALLPGPQLQAQAPWGAEAALVLEAPVAELQLVAKVIRADGITAATMHRPVGPLGAGTWPVKLEVAPGALASGAYRLEWVAQSASLVLASASIPLAFHHPVATEGVVALAATWTLGSGP